MEGSGFKEDLEQFIKGPREYAPPEVRENLKIYGNNKILYMYIIRTPINSILKTIVDIFANKTYDTLYHLYMIVKLDNNKFYIIEKNEVVVFREVKGIDINEETEYRELKIDYLNITVNSMFMKSEGAIGKNRFWVYSATKANCQDFIYNLLVNSEIGNKDIYNFVKQDTENIVNNTIANFFDFITNTASRLDILIYGSALSPLFLY